MSDKIWHTDETDNCKIVEELLSAFFDEELNETADAAVRHHLDGCTACATKLQELKATVETINSLPCEATPESDLWPGIVAVTGDRER
ncbi:MAG: anti-sigma factor family protein, partial [Gemmatimonadales bacterium]